MRLIKYILIFCFRTFVFSANEHMNKKNSGRFILYAILGFGLPILSTILIFLIDTFQIGHVLPEVGNYWCFLSKRGAKYLFHLPIFILLCFNSLVFLVTVLSLRSRYRQNSAASSNRVALITNQVRAFMNDVMLM